MERVGRKISIVFLQLLTLTKSLGEKNFLFFEFFCLFCFVFNVFPNKKGKITNISREEKG